MMRQVELAIGHVHGEWTNYFVDTDMPYIDLMDEQKLLTLVPDNLKEVDIAFVHLMYVEEDEEGETMETEKMMPFETKEYFVKSEPKAILLATSLIHSSVWFELTPLPDDEWEFILKNEPHGEDVKLALELCMR